MPTLTLHVPKSDWAVLEAEAEREGVNVRTLCTWKLKRHFDLPIRTPQQPEPQVEEAAA